MIDDYNAYEPKQKKNLSEDSFRICIGDFGKRLLYPIDAKEFDDFDYLLNKEAKTLRGKEGNFNVENRPNFLHISYQVNLNKSPKVLEIWYKKRADSLDGTSQSIEVGEDIAKFGVRPFFQCLCGRKATVFYMPAREHFFKCRKCANIIYESQTINKHTMNGLLWHTHKMIKLANRREKIKRMFYSGKLSKRGQKFTELFAEWNNEIKTRNQLSSSK